MLSSNGAHRTEFQVRKTGKHFPVKFLIIGWFFFIGSIALLSGCRNVVRVPVTPEDIQKAFEASQEGDLAFGRKDYYAALIKYLEAARLNPNTEVIYNKLGISYSQLKYYAQAIDSFSHSIELDRKYSYSYNNLGSVYFAQGNMKKAEKYFRKAISLKNDEASFHMNMGSVLLERKKQEKAMAEWRKALAIDPKIFSRSSAVSLMGNSSSSMERRYLVARLLASAGKVDPAIESLKQAITEGFSDIDQIRKEQDFDPIRNDKRFVDFIANVNLLIKLKSKVGLPEDTK
jgi:tetratricopeptide (TPR) repeat protein